MTSISRVALLRATARHGAGIFGCLVPIACAQAGAPSPIVVTGTRIATPEAGQLERTDTVTGERMAERGHANIADTLNELPGVRGSLTPADQQPAYGQGVNFINLMGLGSNRTLTLVNGRRMVSSNVPSGFGASGPGNQVDLNAIPAILVDRVDRLAAGGAPVYGSDAIAGTVNVRLTTRRTGLETRLVSGIAEAGDNARRAISVAGGFDFGGGRGNITAALAHDRVAAVTARARKVFDADLGNAANPCSLPAAPACTAFNQVALLGPAGRTPANDGRINPAIGFNDTSADGFPGSILVRELALPAVNANGIVMSGPGAYAWQFAPDGSLVPYDKGVIFGAPVPGPLAQAATASGGDGLRLFDYLAVTSRIRRTQAALFASFDLADRVALFGEALYYRGKAKEPVELPAFNAPLFRGASGALTFRTDNPFLSAQARAQLAALGYAGTFQLSRAHADLADLTGSSHSRLHRIVAGVRGTAALGGGDYDFELSVNHGLNRFTDHGETIDQQRFVNALNVALVDGRIVCSPTPVVTGFPAGQTPLADPACQPLNLFGAGAPSPAARSYVVRRTVSRSRMEQFVVNANFGGSPFAVQGNPVTFNAGYERRSERAAFRPDPFLRAGLGRAATVNPVSGSYRLDELFGEALLPLLTPENRGPVDRLTLFARARRVESNRSGGFTAWSAGGVLAPVPGVELRGSFTRSLRAPSILELHAPRLPVNLGVPDLCSAANIGAGPSPAIRKANCAAFLSRYPAATPLVAGTASVPGLSGGNPDLRNEQADSLSFGGIVRPPFVPGLSIGADYFSIRIARPIASLTVNDIVQGCFDNPRFDVGDPVNGNPFCSLIRRDASGQVVADAASPAVTTGFVNGKRIRASGVQARVDYRTALDGIALPGEIAIAADVFHLRRRLIDVTGIAPARSDGLVGDPRWQGQVRLRYAVGHWALSTQVNYTGTQLLSRNNRGPAPNDAREFDHFHPFATVDASLRIHTGESARITLSVTNLFDRVGQRYRGEIVPVSINDKLGRRLALSFQRDW